MVLQGLVSRYCLGGWTLRCRLYLCVATVMWWDTDKVEEAPWRFWEDEQYPANVDDRMLQAVLRYHFCLSPLVVTTTRCLVYSWTRRWAGTDKPCLTMFGIVSTMIREGAYFKWTWFGNQLQSFCKSYQEHSPRIVLSIPNNVKPGLPVWQGWWPWMWWLCWCWWPRCGGSRCPGREDTRTSSSASTPTSVSRAAGTPWPASR